MSPYILRQLEELNLLKHSLLQGESLTFTPPNDPETIQWETLLEAYSEGTLAENPEISLSSQPRIQVKTEDPHIWFEVALPPDYGDPQVSHSKRREHLSSAISIRGDSVTRSEQETWQGIIASAISELGDDSEYPIFDLISLHLLPRLHEFNTIRDTVPTSQSDNSLQHKGGVTATPSLQPPYHALFTSHHLISPTKRRNLQTWSSQLSISGFAKVGYPGIIYGQGTKEDIEEFVANIKAMQWLALKVRFVEPAPKTLSVEPTRDGPSDHERHWVEFERVGEVVQEMRRIGRESYVVEMGIGSTGTPSNSKP
ncbi:hypothetical protein NLI96_g6504 [Meripilus lineatus]|uniref:Small nuclear ribonucleoprotein Prp3 C-terminal domain-containing protein n=1 Tax=Meripilus lineatus TaxID=2056292 RepID=A0AAD5YCW4_9APHY|nr:hypothetical protein NLI96_g6504 [Physisporinus lineatus]